METVSKIKRELQNISGGKNLPLIASVVSIQDETCTIELVTGLKISDVRLKSSVNESDDFLIVTPKVGSKVVVLSLTGELDNLMAIAIDQAEKIHYSQDGLEIMYDSDDGKVMIKNESASLHDMFEELVDIIKTIKVPTPSGLSNTPITDTITRLEQFETNFKTLLK